MLGDVRAKKTVISTSQKVFSSIFCHYMVLLVPIQSVHSRLVGQKVVAVAAPGNECFIFHQGANRGAL